MVENVTLCSIEEGLEAGDIAVILVDHDEFKGLEIDPQKGMLVVDTRGIWD